jgi:tRNA (guanine10-N2)-methyltransferase
MHDIVKDLLQFAAQRLVLHGRLVFWLPITEDMTFSLEHPCFTILADGLQSFGNWARRLITLEKTIDYKDINEQEININVISKQELRRKIYSTT